MAYRIAWSDFTRSVMKRALTHDSQSIFYPGYGRFRAEIEGIGLTPKHLIMSNA